MRTIRGNEIGMIFQDPITALHPVFTVGRQLSEGLRVHCGMDKAQARARALELLREVRIPEPERRLDQYPHELSVGQRLRPEEGGVAEALVRQIMGDNATHVVSYGTEAGQFQQAGYSAAICCPGDIAQAHQPDEFITRAQFEAGHGFMRDLVDRLASG